MLEIKIFSINSNKICNSTPPISRFQILINLQFLNLGGVVKTNKQLLDLLDKLLIENKDLNIDEYGLLAKHVDVQVKQIN
ncbi:hypothetical protein PACTADRAFT_51790 [Pachysolen tannophilus NRRL Y-2460]|uniref:Uncharacterized protein n=1 Tax=Pachysolen tannophilus NRRL Y-2460 TaxID=669874 RepID=A0A1E4TN26_PACTA|nr:hypothetical protein PACTADRAFT_51790 [Pachysolen tannophilus NRRL Y-2460]